VNDLSVLELMDVNRLDCHLSVLRREAEERIALRTAISERTITLFPSCNTSCILIVMSGTPSELGEDLLRAIRSGRLAGRRGKFDPCFAQDRSRSAGSFRSNA